MLTSKIAAALIAAAFLASSLPASATTVQIRQPGFAAGKAGTWADNSCFGNDYIGALNQCAAFKEWVVPAPLQSGGSFNVYAKQPTPGGPGYCFIAGANGTTGSAYFSATQTIPAAASVPLAFTNPGGLNAFEAHCWLPQNAEVGSVTSSQTF